ncbi:SPOR domain-containing protein [Thiolapillus sp.]|nr:SPOR domain-containing protein [Thiolapillus sp.]
MIRLLLAMLIALNVALFLWIQYGNRTAAPTRPEPLSRPDFGQIRLVGEPETAEEPVIEAKMNAQEPVQAPQPHAGDTHPAEPEPATVPEVTSETETQPESEPQIQQESSQQQVLDTLSTPSEPAPEPRVQPIPTESQPEVLYCGELGPMRSRNMAEGYRRTLAAGKAEVRVETRPGKETVGYWVMIPETPDVARAEAMLKRLVQAGFKDLWLMREGEHKNAISMGLYTQERYAQRHADNIHEKGFDPVVVPKQKKARVYWVLFSHAGVNELQKIEAQKLPSNAALEKKVCDQALTDP